VAMNIAAQSKHWGLYYLQQNNIKNRPAKIIVVSEDGEMGGSSSSSKMENVVQSVVEKNTLETTQPIKREIVTNAGIYVTGGPQIDEIQSVLLQCSRIVNNTTLMPGRVG